MTTLMFHDAHTAKPLGQLRVSGDSIEGDPSLEEMVKGKSGSDVLAQYPDGWSNGYLRCNVRQETSLTSLTPWTVELVGPKGYIHGWIKVGADIEHKDSSRGKVTSYDPNTQTVHADWHAGPRSKVNGGKGTTKAYHLKRESSGAPNTDTKPTEVKPVAPASDLTKPTIRSADLLGITIGKKAAVRNLPAGVAVHAIHGSTNSHAVFHNNEHIGYVNKRSGYTTLGESGAAYMSKNTGYAAYDRRNSRLAHRDTISDAANHVYQSWQRTQGAAGPKV